MPIAADAAEACWHCPALERCRAELDARFPGWGEGQRRSNPRGLVWAGMVFSHRGRLLTRAGLRRSARARAAMARRATATHGSEDAPTGPHNIPRQAGPQGSR